MQPSSNVSRAPTLVPARGTPLYVHLPFCVAKCTYCDFYSLEAEGQDLSGTLDALIVELERRAPEAPRTVFLGGGTPSLYPVEELARLLDALDRFTGFRRSAVEVTLEANPESLDEAKARSLVELGVDRLSIGVQSLDPRILELFGRVHDADQGLAALAAARRAGVPRTSVDLIYAAPGQTVEGWLADLERVLALRPGHVSAYHLAFEEGTLMTRWLAEGRVKRHDEARELAFFEATRGAFAAAGYEAYEVSNFCLSGQQCHHNLGYWRNEPYVGVGPSAVSQVDGTRFGNPRGLSPWRRAVNAGRFPAAWEETLAPGARLGETWWLGLRTAEGVDPAAARRTAGVAAGVDEALPTARALAADGLLEVVGPRFRLSTRGWPLADAVAARFLAPAAASDTAPAR